MTRSFLVLLVAAAIALPAAATDDKKGDGAKEALRRMQQACRKLEQDKTQVEQDKATLEEQLKEAQGKLKDAQGRLKGSRKLAESAAETELTLKDQMATTLAEKEALAVKLAEAQQTIEKLAEQHQAADAERRRLEPLAAQQKQSIEVCRQANAQLHREGMALLDQYQSKGCFDAVLQNEPLTGLRQVQIENMVDAKRDKLDEFRLDQTATR